MLFHFVVNLMIRRLLHFCYRPIHYNKYLIYRNNEIKENLLMLVQIFLQYFHTVGWVTGRASSL